MSLFFFFMKNGVMHMSGQDSDVSN